MSEFAGLGKEMASLVMQASAVSNQSSTSVSATVEKVEDGVAYVRFDGADVLTPVETGMTASVGDSVSVRIGDGRAVVTDNLTRPATDDRLAGEAAILAQSASDAASAAETVADEAMEIAEATGQHFWDDSNGAHVTDVTRDDWEEAVEDGFSDLSDSKPYHNALWNSLGMLFRRALYNLVSISRSAIAFFDGTGNSDSNIVAQFGSSGARIGKAASGHADVTSSGLEVFTDASTSVASFGSTARVGTSSGARVVTTSNGIDIYNSSDKKKASFGSDQYVYGGDGTYPYAKASSDGVRIYQSANNHADVTSSGLEVYQGGSSVASFGSTSRVGTSSGARVVTTSNGIDVYNSSGNKKASFGSNQYVYGGSGTYPYMKASSDGVRLYQSANNHADVTSSGLEVYQGGSSVASFGSSGFQAGKTGESYMTGDYHSLQLVDQDGDTYFYVSDLRDTNGHATLTETFISYNGENQFTVSFSVYSEVSATDSSNPNNTATRNDKTYTFANNPDAGATITITYVTTSSDVKAYTFGRRLSGSSVGGYSVAEGDSVTASGAYSHAEGKETIASGAYSHAEGWKAQAQGKASHSEGESTLATSNGAHAEGTSTWALRSSAHAEGYQTRATAGSAHAEGSGTEASGDHSHAEGYQTKASGIRSHAEGMKTTASTYYAHAEGYYTTASGQKSHAEGDHTTASGECAHAEGKDTTATAYTAHAEGTSDATAVYSHAEGYATTASGSCAHSEGSSSTASGSDSHAQNEDTIAASNAQTALGKYNVSDANGTYAVIVGNGTPSVRSNALTVDWNGNVACGTVNGVDLSNLATVATSGSYSDLTNKPTGSTLLNALSTGTGAPTDDSYMIAESNTTAGTFIRKKASVIWSYIKGKADAVYPLLLGGTALSSTDNLDSLTTVGTYYVSGSSSTPQNAPTGFTVGKVIVDIPHGLSSSSIRGQHYLAYGSGREAYRKFESNSWSEWQYEAPRTYSTLHANRFLATPNGSAGASSYRAIVDADLPTPLTPQTYNVKSLITQSSTQSGNFTISAASLIVSGYVAMLTVDFTVSAALTANTEYSLGTLPTSIRPAGRANAGVGDSRFFAAIASGTMYLRPQAATTASTTTTYRFNSTYIMSNAYTG